MAGGSPRIQKNELPPITNGYIMIPRNVDRESYIQNCFRMNRVCVLIEGGLFKTDVYITNEAIQNISFPEEVGKKGTQVIIASGVFRNQPVIIGTIQGNDETQAWSEDIIRFRRTVKGTTMMICMDPKNKQMNVNVFSEEKADLNIRMVGNTENKINVQTSGEINVVADEKVKVTGYKKIEAEIINTEVEAKEPNKESRKITLDLDKLEYRRKTKESNEKETLVVIDDEKIAFGFHDNRESLQMSDQNVTISFDEGKEQIQLAQNLIKILTGSKVNINNASEPLTLANTLISLLNNVENQITTLKNAWSTAAAAAVPGTDGGKAGLSAGMSSVTGIFPLNFNQIKSKVVFSD